MPTEKTRIYHSERDKIAVWALGEHRWLTFTDGVMQSWINLTDPGELSPPVQALMAALLFIPTPKKTLMLGMGAGSLARFFHHKQPHLTGDLVEWSAPVVAVARQFFDFPQPCAWQIKVMDARDYINSTPQHYDFIAVDIVQGEHTAPWVAQCHYLQQIRACLAPRSAVVFNLLVADAHMFTHFLRNIRQTFAQKTVCLSVPGYKNIVLIAFSDDPQYCAIEHLKARVTRLQHIWGLPFETFIDQMVRDNPIGSGTLHR